MLELPVDGLKIDRRFVAGIDVEPTATKLARAILSLSKSLGISCVAEGAEQPYQRDRLFELGCTAVQGWLFSSAVPPEKLLTMLPNIAPTISDVVIERIDPVSTSGQASQRRPTKPTE